MQIWAANLDFAAIGEEVYVSDSIRRPNVERVCVDRVDKLSVVM